MTLPKEPVAKAETLVVAKAATARVETLSMTLPKEPVAKAEILVS